MIDDLIKRIQTLRTEIINSLAKLYFNSDEIIITQDYFPLRG
jgi:hypothetical protein